MTVPRPVPCAVVKAITQIKLAFFLRQKTRAIRLLVAGSVIHKIVTVERVGWPQPWLCLNGQRIPLAGVIHRRIIVELDRC